MNPLHNRSLGETDSWCLNYPPRFNIGLPPGIERRYRC